MARQERQVDPADGPLPAFAYELRLIREKAGNPTYRTLAKAAGFSPTTLSEAASGRRKPSLDVVLAYVGACGGDVDNWREKWEQLNQGLTPLKTEIPEPSLPESVKQQSENEKLPGAKSTKRRWATIATIATTGTTALLLTIFWPSQSRSPQRTKQTAMQSAQCPPINKNAVFTGVTRASGAHVREGATRDSPVTQELPGDCKVGFTGMCLGEVVHDGSVGTADARWFVLESGVVSSAIIHGNPPRNFPLIRCKNDQPPPGSISFSVSRNEKKPSEIIVSADGLNTHIFGFSVSSAMDKAGQPWNWHQIGFIEKQPKQTQIHWDTTAQPESGKTKQFVVMAVACAGGDGPTNVMDVKAIRFNGNHVETSQVSLNSKEYANAANTACRYPSRTTQTNQSRSPG